jgi:alpha-ribazole phosphatase
MSKVTRWWWVRHAPVKNINGRIYGQTDKEADVSDRVAMKALAEALPEGAVWVTSHLSRTIDTAAAIVAAGLAAPEPLIERELVEQSFGDWHGLAWDELRAADKQIYKDFWAAPGDTAPPNGESVADLIARCSTAILRLTEEYSGRDIVAVTHGGTIRAALSLALGLSAEQALSLRIDNLSLSRLDHVAGGILAQGRGGAWRIVTLNNIPGATIGPQP